MTHKIIVHALHFAVYLGVLLNIIACVEFAKGGKWFIASLLLAFVLVAVYYCERKEPTS